MYIVLQQKLLVIAMYRKRGQTFCAQVKFARSVLQDAKRKQKGVYLHLYLLLLYNKVTQKVFKELPYDQSVQEPSDPSGSGSDQSDPPAPQPATEYSSMSKKRP